MGTGSTAVASVRLGVPFLGFEIDPEYVEIAGERIAEELESKAKRA
jgi:DNA modification methylase